jgi:HTH-type transcriptional regulator/antitoxin HigA
MLEEHEQPSPRGRVLLHPGDMLREMLKQRGWTQDDLALIIGRSAKTINDIVRRRTGMTPETAACLAAAFGNAPEEWMRAETAYRLSLVEVETSEIERRAKLFSFAPVRDMQRRGWIKETDDLSELESEMSFFFDAAPGLSPWESNLKLSVAARRTIARPDLSPPETAWCFRVRQLASTLMAAPFVPERLPRARSELRRLATHPKEARHLPKVLASYGIRFVVVEPIADVKIDGAALWDEIGPIMALSIRHDRIDGFWFTVMHEFSHIANSDPVSVDTEMVDAATGVIVRLARDEAEERADREAGSSLIPTKEMDSFVSRVGPLYPQDRIIQFANRIHIHPGIIVGQLQYRDEIGYAAMRPLLVKIRENVISTALTDGWGQSISPSVVRRLK